ncbi:MAG: hypothetical protein QOE71_1403 [Pseudonocardiales bacterium]|nr:hypothetical protein [Pseudonocardiales bacterium]
MVRRPDAPWINGQHWSMSMPLGRVSFAGLAAIDLRRPNPIVRLILSGYQERP